MKSKVNVLVTLAVAAVLSTTTLSPTGATESNTTNVPSVGGEFTGGVPPACPTGANCG